MNVSERLVGASRIVTGGNATIALCFITRHIRDGVRRTDRIVDKYSFVAHRVDLSTQLNEFFLGIVRLHVDKLSEVGKFILEDYAVINDDLDDKIYSYILNDSLSFAAFFLNIC